MQVSFTFDDPAEAANVLEFILDGNWPSKNAGKPKEEEKAPWEADDKPARGSSQRSSQRASNDADDDPWADSASSRSSGSGRSSGRSSAKCADMEAGKDFPPSGSYDKATPSAFMVWEFDTNGAPTCDGGHPAAKVTAYKGKDHAAGKPSYQTYWCPVGFGKKWKNKCEFSEFT